MEEGVLEEGGLPGEYIIEIEIGLLHTPARWCVSCYHVASDRSFGLCV
jgi:hypothetical protein